MSTTVVDSSPLDTNALDSKLAANERLLQHGVSLSTEQEQQLKKISLSLKTEQDLSDQDKRSLASVLNARGQELFIAEPDQFLIDQHRLKIARRLQGLEQADSSVRLSTSRQVILPHINTM